MIGIYIYRKILERINLSKKELLKLKNKLIEENICCGPFLKNNKMCPTTTALSIKLKKKFNEKNVVRKNLKEIGVSKVMLLLFYLTFDLPSIISHKFFIQRLKEFRKLIDDLINYN